MADCRYKKILQFYLDSSGAGPHFKDLEEHLKTCPECQLQLAELEELNSAALDIIDEAPEKEYWDSFPVRVRNRITARSIEPAEIVRKRRAPWYSAFRMASVLVALMFIAAYSILVLRRGTSTLDNPASIADRPSIISEQPVSSGSPLIPAVAAAQPDARAVNGPSSSVDGPVIRPVAGVGTDESRGRHRRAERPEAVPMNIMIKDLAGQLRGVRGAEINGPRLETEIRSYAPVFTSYLADIDPSFHMKESFISQRLLSGLNNRPRNGFHGLYQGSYYGYGSLSLDGSRVLPTNETQSTWGYTSISTDTSKSAEIRQYFLELELMESK
ncbi:MAG: hypothetical protein A2W25_15825 [candidate division Zixibacteria bacterium RBG_16_53_22]|nr:MAG: hypothetical protein A2W25_15825 [candidate division Zixibacteria bacterium RBG_16_53_22]